MTSAVVRLVHGWHVGAIPEHDAAWPDDAAM